MIRNAKESDLPGIVDVYNQSIASHQVTGDLKKVSVESRQVWFEQHQPYSYPLWVKELDGQIIGWLSFQPFSDRAAFEITTEISIYIANDYKSQGFGKELLKYGINQSELLGFKNLIAFVFAHNQLSLRLFESFKFTEWGYLPRVAEIDQIDRDLIIMGLRV